MVTMTVRPLRATLRTACITMAAARASRPDVGSSMNTTDGLATSSTPICAQSLEAVRIIANHPQASPSHTDCPAIAGSCAAREGPFSP